MKAYVLNGIDKLEYQDVEKPKCPPDWAIVKVKAAGICSSDIPRIFTKGTYHFPTIPGHEFAGVVDEVRSDDRSMIGRHVGVFPLIPCKQCQQCQNKHYEMCENYDYVGSRRDGGFAEYVAVPVWNLVPLDDEIAYDEAAMLEPLSVALHTVKQAEVKHGNSVGIVGTGMIGFAAAQWAKKYGARNVTIIGRTVNKAELARRIEVDYATFEQDIPEFDVVIEAVGSNSSIIQSIQSVKPGGTLILTGNPKRNINLPQDVYWRILRKQITMRGTWNSYYDGKNDSDWTEAVKAIEAGTISVRPLISHVFKQEQLMDALLLMKEQRESYCKIITIWNED